MVSLGLEDKVVLVTGGNRGIGSAIVGLLEELGAKVAYPSFVTFKRVKSRTCCG